MTSTSTSPWLYSSRIEGLFILGPAFAVTALVVLFPAMFGAESPVSPMAWLLLVVGIDVAHVYSTLFRTYFDKREFARYRKPLIWIPLLSLPVMMGLYFWAGSAWFWTALAYLAVYHFVRQQYGFFRLYSRKEKMLGRWEKHLDSLAIYGATVYPLLYWHCNLPRRFHWFMPGDFLAIPWPWLADVAGLVFAAILLSYIAKEFYAARRGRPFNLPKQAILTGTVLVWYVGIVLYNGDLAFTATNVAAHGIPYMALIWLHGRKRYPGPQGAGKWYSLEMLPAFLVIILFFAYLEEGLWDGLVWRDHEGFFPWANGLPWLESSTWLVLLVPLLALPQVTHYLIDGFIWKRKDV